MGHSGSTVCLSVYWSQFYPLHCFLLPQEQTKVLPLMHIDMWVRFHSVPSLSHICFPFSSVAQSCPTLCNPMNHSMPGLPVPYQLPESTQTHVHWISDAVQPSCPLLSPSPPSFNLPSIRVFSCESALHIRWPNIGVSDSTSVLPMNIQDWFPLGWTGWIFLRFKGLSRVFSNTSVQKHKVFGAQLFL